ncbi:hypothetical protein LTR86_006290 [Recurvomyces mirabilis]|nr:hypothetical protein LTR86_006290 [Recurvomyces mirabilis]
MASHQQHKIFNPIALPVRPHIRYRGDLEEGKPAEDLRSPLPLTYYAWGTDKGLSTHFPIWTVAEQLPSGIEITSDTGGIVGSEEPKGTKRKGKFGHMTVVGGTGNGNVKSGEDAAESKKARRTSRRNKRGGKAVRKAIARAALRQEDENKRILEAGGVIEEPQRELGERPLFRRDRTKWGPGSMKPVMKQQRTLSIWVSTSDSTLEWLVTYWHVRDGSTFGGTCRRWYVLQAQRCWP